MDIPEIQYTSIGESRIAYQVLGEGPDLVYFAGIMSNLDVRWEDPSLAGFHRRLASFSRLIMFDRRGSGLSDSLPGGQEPTWEPFVEDVAAVLDAVGSERACIFAVLDAGPAAMLFAASHPERTSALVLANTSARFVEDPDYPQGLPKDTADGIVRAMKEYWGTELLARIAIPSRSDDQAFARWYAKFQRASTKPKDAAAWLRGILDIDVRDALPSVRVPTLVLHARDHAVSPIAQGRYIAEAVPDGRFVELPGADGVVWTDNCERVVAEVQELLTGVRRDAVPDRVLATVLFTDIVGSTERATALGDRRWADVLRAHNDVVSTAVAAFRGRLVKTTGDGAIATFDGPSRAVMCATEIRARLKDHGLQVRAGIHTGEVEVLGDDIGGIGVHIAARVLHEAEPDQILATRTVRDLMVGSEMTFAEQGARALKGVPGEWMLFEPAS